MSIERILGAARSLWRDQRRWRWTVIVASVATVGALLTRGAGIGAGPGTVPGGGGGSGPIVIQPTRPVDPGVDGRLRQFYQSYTSASAHKAQPGAWCERLAAAYIRLEENDEASASGAQARAIAEAKQCVPLVGESNERVGLVDTEYERFGESRTLSAGDAVLTAASQLTDFDRSRDLAATGAAADKLAALEKGVRTYRQFLARMATVAPLYRAKDPATLATAIELAELHRAKPSFAGNDPELSAAERQGLSAAAAADAAIAESDRRIAVLATAFGRRSDDPVGLAMALGALTPFDRARLRDGTVAAIDLNEAEKAARDSVGVAMDRSAQSYLKAATFESATLLTQLDALANELTANVSAQSAAIEQAKADLAGSELRLKALNDVAGRWRQVKASGQRDAGVETGVGQVLMAIVPARGAEANPFDAGAMTAQDKTALDTLIGAWVEIQGRVAPTQRRSLTVALKEPVNADAATATFIANVARELERLGFTMSRTAADAALVVTLSALGLQEGGINAAGLPQRKASVRGSLLWTYSGRMAEMGTVTGVGIDRDKRAITEAALRAAAEQVARTVLAKVEGA